MTQHTDSSPRPSQVFADRVRYWRDERGYSAEELARRVNALGIDMNRAIVANIEHGRRDRISIEELFAFSIALDVSPIMLCLPLQQGGDVAVTPNVVVGRWLAYDWLTGVVPIRGSDVARHFHTTRQPIDAYLSFADAREQARAASRQYHNRDQIAPPYIEALQRLVDEVRTMEELGLPARDLVPEDLRADVDRFDVEPTPRGQPARWRSRQLGVAHPGNEV